MANYFKLVNGIVIQGMIADTEFMSTFKDSSPGTWIEDSDSIKGTGGTGRTYNDTLKAWITESPYPSYVLNETSLEWEAPVTLPTDGKEYDWDETTKSWKEIT